VMLGSPDRSLLSVLLLMGVQAANRPGAAIK
jgi:hypothetical protein